MRALSLFLLIKRYGVDCWGTIPGMNVKRLKPDAHLKTLEADNESCRSFDLSQSIDRKHSPNACAHNVALFAPLKWTENETTRSQSASFAWASSILNTGSVNRLSFPLRGIEVQGNSSICIVTKKEHRSRFWKTLFLKPETSKRMLIFSSTTRSLATQRRQQVFLINGSKLAPRYKVLSKKSHCCLRASQENW